MGDRLQDVAFKDCVVDAIIAKTKVLVNGSRWYPIKPTITTIYSNTLPDSTLRRLVVDQHVHVGPVDWLGEHSSADDFPPEFLFDLAKGLLEKRATLPRPLPQDGPDPCLYHEHTKTSGICYKSRFTGQ